MKKIRKIRILDLWLSVTCCVIVVSRCKEWIQTSQQCDLCCLKPVA